MPRFNFHLSATHAILWHFDRHPEPGELIALGETYGVCEVAKMVPRSDPTVDAEYDVIRVRGMTADELDAFAQGDASFTLPPHCPRYRYTT